MRGRPLDRATTDPLVHFRLAPIAFVVVPERPDVLAPPVREAFQEKWPVSGSAPLDRLAGSGIDAEDVVTVHLLGRQRIGARSLEDLHAGRLTHLQRRMGG